MLLNGIGLKNGFRIIKRHRMCYEMLSMFTFKWNGENCLGLLWSNKISEYQDLRDAIQNNEFPPSLLKGPEESFMIYHVPYRH